MEKSIKDDQKVQVIEEFYISDNALLQYRETSQSEVSAVIRYVESSSIKESTLYSADPTKKTYSLDISEDQTTIAVLETVESKKYLRRLYYLEDHTFETPDFIDVGYNRKFKNKVNPQLILKSN